MFLFFCSFLLPQKGTKKGPATGYRPVAEQVPDDALLLLWCRAFEP